MKFKQLVLCSALIVSTFSSAWALQASNALSLRVDEKPANWNQYFSRIDFSAYANGKVIPDCHRYTTEAKSSFPIYAGFSGSACKNGNLHSIKFIPKDSSVPEVSVSVADFDKDDNACSGTLMLKKEGDKYTSTFAGIGCGIRTGQ